MNDDHGNNRRSISPRRRMCWPSRYFATSGRGAGSGGGSIDRLERNISPRRRPSLEEGAMDLGEWQRGVVRGGTLRPGRSSSFVSIRTKEIDRPSSKMSEPGELGAYRRSLKLLGLDDDSVGLDIGRPRSATIRPKTKGAQPKLKTRLERRTVSTEDLRSALTIQDSPKIAPSRGLVSRAVYEAWYFKKVEHARQLAEAKMQQEKIEKWQFENEKLEKQRRGQLSYDEWLRKKEEEKNNRKPPSNETGRKKGGPLTVKRPVSREEAEAAFEKWKNDKAKREAKSAEDEARRKLKEEEAERKREEAQKAFESWKKRRDEERKRVAEKEAEQREAKERALQQQQEAKQKDADASFRAWSQAKAKEAADKLRKTRTIEEKKAKEETQKQSERRYEATQAFQEWLDHVLEREERRRML